MADRSCGACLGQVAVMGFLAFLSVLFGCAALWELTVHP